MSSSLMRQSDASEHRPTFFPFNCPMVNRQSYRFPGYAPSEKSRKQTHSKRSGVCQSARCSLIRSPSPNPFCGVYGATGLAGFPTHEMSCGHPSRYPAYRYSSDDSLRLHLTARQHGRCLSRSSVAAAAGPRTMCGPLRSLTPTIAVLHARLCATFGHFTSHSGCTRAACLLLAMARQSWTERFCFRRSAGLQPLPASPPLHSTTLGRALLPAQVLAK